MRPQKSLGRATLIKRPLHRKDKKMKKGIAFPTCVSVNHCVCAKSPPAGDDAEVLKKGDLVKM